MHVTGMTTIQIPGDVRFEFTDIVGLECHPLSGEKPWTGIEVKGDYDAVSWDPDLWLRLRGSRGNSHRFSTRIPKEKSHPPPICT